MGQLAEVDSQSRKRIDRSNRQVSMDVCLEGESMVSSLREGERFTRDTDFCKSQPNRRRKAKRNHEIPSSASESPTT